MSPVSASLWPASVRPPWSGSADLKMGFMPSFCYVRGPVGVISRSGSLSYESCKRLTLAGIGQTTVVGIGRSEDGLHALLLLCTRTGRSNIAQRLTVL